MNILDITIVGIYLFICLVIGFYNSGKIKNLKEYTVGHRNFPTAILVATIFATFIGSETTIGTIDLIYRVGIVFLVARLCLPISLFVLSYLFAKKIQRFSHLISFTDIMGELYGKAGGVVTKILILCYNIGILAGQAISIGCLFNYFFGMTYFWGILLGFGVLTIYSSLGGILAVAFTDFFQFTIFFIAIPIACGIAYNDMGGYKSIINQIPTSHFSLDYIKENTATYIAMVLYFFIIPFSDPPLIQRMLLARSAKQISTALKLAALLSVCFTFVMGTIGFIVFIKYPDLDPKYGLYHFLNTYFAPGLLGLMISGMLAVLMSTVDSWLNCTSSIVVKDFLRTMLPKMSDTQELRSVRIVTFIISGIAMMIALYSQEIMTVFYGAMNFWYPVIFIPFVAGVLGFKTKSASFVCGAIVAVLTCAIAALLTNELGLISLAIATASNAIGFFGYHYYYCQTKKVHTVL